MNQGKLSYALLYVFLLNFQIYSQNAEWISYTNSERIYAMIDNGNSLWIGTDGGLIKFNKTTENFSFYNKANAYLPDNHIRSLALDSSGYLWIGTRYSGIGKFDGKYCQVFNSVNSGLPQDQWNTCIAAAPDGRMWIGSLRFLSILNGGVWKSYETGNPHSAYYAIHSLVFDSDTTWVGASWGLGKFTCDSLIEGYGGITKEILSLIKDKNGAFWIGTSGLGLMRLEGTNYTVLDTTNSGIPGNSVFDMSLDAQGNLWLASEKGVAKFNGTTWLIYNTRNSPLTEDGISSIEIDAQGIIWIGTFHNGLFRFDGQNWKKYKISNSELLDNGVSSIAVSSIRNYWITCYGVPKYLSKFDGFKWEHYDSTNFDIFNSSFVNVYSDNNKKIWIGSGILIFYQSSEGFRVYNIDDPHSGSYVKIDDQGNIWMASSVGLQKFNGENWIVYNKDNSPLPSNQIASLVFDFNNNLWLSTSPAPGERGVLMKFDGINWVTSYSCEIGYWIPAIEIDISGNIWIGIMNDKIGIEEGDGIKKFDGERWTNYDIYNSELPSNSVVALRTDNLGNLWIGTYAGGLAKFNGTDEWAIYNSKNSGLPGDNVELIEIDSMNNKWLGVQYGGLSVFREGGVILTDIKKDNLEHLPKGFTLYQNYPNPFNPSTTIKLSLPRVSFVTLKIYNTIGQEVAQLVSKEMHAGTYVFNWNVGNNAAGVYYCRFTAGIFSETKKLVILK